MVLTKYVMCTYRISLALLMLSKLPYVHLTSIVSCAKCSMRINRRLSALLARQSAFSVVKESELHGDVKYIRCIYYPRLRIYRR